MCFDTFYRWFYFWLRIFNNLKIVSDGIWILNYFIIIELRFSKTRRKRINTGLKEYRYLQTIFVSQISQIASISNNLICLCRIKLLWTRSKKYKLNRNSSYSFEYHNSHTLNISCFFARAHSIHLSTFKFFINARTFSVLLTIMLTITYILAPCTIRRINILSFQTFSNWEKKEGIILDCCDLWATNISKHPNSTCSTSSPVTPGRLLITLFSPFGMLAASAANALRAVKPNQPFFPPLRS